MTKPRKNIIADARMYDIAMQMKGTPVSYPKPTRMQRFKKRLRFEKEGIFILCGCLILLIAVLCTTTSPILAFFIGFPIGVCIGLVLIDMFYL